MDLLSRGLIPSGYLDACKARILLMIALMNNQSMEEIRSIFSEFLA
jgi:L-asparaginase/Glu-tRNA(Gln) amidotransferase subunit D